MKKQMTKYTVVAVVGFLALCGVFLLAKEAGLISGRIFAAAPEPAAQELVPAKRKAVLLEAGLGREDELQSCYETYLHKNPKIDEGTVEVHWMLDGRGKISSMEMVHSDLEDEVFLACLHDKIERMTFRPPPKARPTLVAHKFNFKKRTPSSLDFKQASGARNSSEE